MKLENLPIWLRILAAKPRGCKATRPINILRAVLAAGGLRQAGPEKKTANWRDYISGLDLVDRYSAGEAGLPCRKTGHPVAIRTFTEGVREDRRAAADPKFRRQLKSRRAKAAAADARHWGLIMHIAERWHATRRSLFTSKYASIARGRGAHENVEWDRYSKSYKYPCTYADAGAGIDAGRLWLSPSRGNEISLPVPPPAMFRAAKLDEPHPVGLFAAPVKGQPGVFACMDAVHDAKEWTVAGFCVAGHLVPECVAHGAITLTAIGAEQNAESKRIMIERFGVDRYVRESGMEPISTDDWGTLYDLGSHRVVRLINSTLEPDGSAREYFRAVPSSCQTARAAVAWTFGLDEPEYAPAVMS